MASENLAEWVSSAWVELETVRATLEAIDKGLIRLDVNKYDHREERHNPGAPSQPVVNGRPEDGPEGLQLHPAGASITWNATTVR